MARGTVTFGDLPGSEAKGTGCIVTQMSQLMTPPLINGDIRMLKYLSGQLGAVVL
jgi:hypothetical protein